MKIKQLFLGSAVALMALTACNKNGANTSVPTPEVGATAGVLRIEIASANGGLRAATVDGPNADPAGAGVAGTTGEQGVTTVSTYVFNPDGVFVDSHDYTKSTGALSTASGLSEDAAKGHFLVEGSAALILPFKTTAADGVQNKLFVVVNKPSFFPTSFANISEFEDAVNNALSIEKDGKYVDGLKELTTDDQFMMVGMCPNFNLKKDLTYDYVKGDFSGTELAKNHFAVTVNRVVSKLVVDYTKDDLLTKEFGTGDAKAKLLGYGFDGGVETAGKLYYTLANSNKAMVIYNNPDVKDQGTGNTDPNYVKGVAYGSYVTPNMDKVGTDKDLTTAYNFYKDFFYRISEDLVGNKVGAAAGTTPFTPMALGMQAKTPDYSKGVYFMEADNTTGKWLWANTPVAKIYACVLPSKVYYLKNNTTTLEAMSIKSLSALKGITEFKDDAIKTVTADGSFLRGADGRYYASQAAANVAAGKPYNTAAGSGAKTDLYAKGRCLYRFPVNADNYDYTSFKNADNRRNHIYALSISDIVAIGDNYDPTDPTDPNVPHPVNPDEPTVKPNKPIAKSTIYAAVKATIANWTVVKNSVTLGK